MINHVVDYILDNVDLTGFGLVKPIEENLRAIAGFELSNCGDYRGLLNDRLGIPVMGDNVDLTLELFINAFILSSVQEGSEDVVLSNSRAVLIAKNTGIMAEKSDVYGMVAWVESELGIAIDSSIEDYNGDDEYESEEYNEETGYEEYNEYEDTPDEYSENDTEDCVSLDEDAYTDTKSTEDEDNSQDILEIMDSIRQYYYQFYKGIVNELAKRYTSLFESGYEVISPAGILSNNGLLGLSGNKRVVKRFDVAVKSMYTLFNTQMNFIEVPFRSNVKIADSIYDVYMSGERKLLYFPNKLLEYAYGRKAPKGDNRDSLNTYEPHSDSANWSSYCKSEVVDSLMAVVSSSVVKFIYKSAVDGDYFSDSLVSRLEGFMKYLQSCLSLCVLMVDYKSKKKGYFDEVYSFKVRVCDPINSIGLIDLTPIIINSAFAGSTGDVPFSYKPRYEVETMIKEYSHEFNRDSSQASPLFAYKAYLSLEKQGVNPTWDNMILGMFEDGTILKNGKKGVSLESRLTHHICAGSRAGKGVMTLNILASAVYSNKAVFYLDRKPDMASLLKNISPNMFVLNGGGYGRQYDTYNEFSNIDSLVNWNNVPNYVTKLLDVPKCWDSLGDLFYMRALKLIVAIIVSRGDGQLNNPNLGGNEGIMLVVDEFKNFQESYSSIVEKVLSKLPPSSYLVDKGKLSNDKLKDYEKAKLLRDFSLSYNDSSMYAVTYLNSLVSDLEFLSTKRDAGFNQKEITLSDIFVIGQHLGYGSLDFRLFRSLIDDSTSSGRYKSSGKTGISSNASSILSKLGIQTASFPFSLVSFKTCDAFFGRNMEDGREVYLAQTNSNSRAFGRLDDKASNFAYLGSFTEDTRSKISGGNVQTNISIANSCIYFKPFLVLNDAKKGDLYTEGMFERCAGEGNEQGSGKEWVSAKEIIEENPNADGTFVHEAVGFEGYMNLMGIDNYSSRLAKSGEIANYVVRDCLGYNGTWFDFITDLRPEWCFTVKDIVDAIKGIRPALSDVRTNPVVSEFVRFNPGIFGLDNTSFDENYDSDDVSVAYFMDEDSLSDYSNPSIQESIVSADMDSVFNDGYDDGDEECCADFSNESEEYVDIYGDTYEQSGVQGSFDTRSRINETGVGNQDLHSVGNEVSQLLDRLKELGVNVTVAEEEYNNDINYGARSSSFVNGGYKDFEHSSVSEFEDISEFDGSVDSYANLVKLITDDVISKFGGVDRITSFRVIGGSLVVNDCSYRCKVKGLSARNIPYDIRRELNAGNIAKMFNFGYLLHMPRLRDLEFDSTDFVYDYVSVALGYGSHISVDLFFQDISSLQCLCIGKKLFRRNNYMEQIKDDDVFYKPRFTTKLANCSEEILGKIGNNSWSFTKNSFKSDDYGLVVKTLAVTGGLVTTGVASGSRVAVKGVRKLFSGIKNLGRSFKDMLDESNQGR